MKTRSLSIHPSICYEFGHDKITFGIYWRKTSARIDELRMTCVELWHSITTIKPIKLSRPSWTRPTPPPDKEPFKKMLNENFSDRLSAPSPVQVSVLASSLILNWPPVHHVLWCVSICHYLSPTATTAGDRTTTTQQQPSAREISHAEWRSGGQVSTV